MRRGIIGVESKTEDNLCNQEHPQPGFIQKTEAQNSEDKRLNHDSVPIISEMQEAQKYKRRTVNHIGVIIIPVPEKISRFTNTHSWRALTSGGSNARAFFHKNAFWRIAVMYGVK